jgi:hypothetical protein
MADYFPAVLIRFFPPSSKRICATRQMSSTKARPIETTRLRGMARAFSTARHAGAWQHGLPPQAIEHIYRYHRRYRITEGREEIQKLKVAGFLFGYMGAGKH